MRGNGELVLLVENEKGARELAETVLSGLGYTVVAAASGLEAGQGVSRAAHRSPLRGCRAARVPTVS
jgi:CheY-like chemotaxis protein